MIGNIAELQAAVEAAPGDTLEVTKDQMRSMLAQLALGNAARRTLVTIGSIARVQPGCAPA